MGLSAADLAREAARFGVAEEQVRRDHLISHMLAALSDESADRDVEPAVAVTPDGLAVQIQILRADGYPRWPVERRAVEQRYADAAPAILTVPTAASFAAWKTATWADRHAPRDLFDLWAMS